MNDELLDVYWRFVAERRAISLRREMGLSAPWTDDIILANHRFTSVYRAEDRVSQFLIREVLYDRDWSAHDLVFRAILFRIFNQPSTWRALERGLHEEPALANFDADHYADILTKYRSAGNTVFNNAYMMCGVQIYSDREKHRNWLYLLRAMVRDGMPENIVRTRTMKEVFDRLRCYQLVGDFLAMQWATDINYSTAINHSENEYVVAGPGALRGLRKLGFRNDPMVGIEYLRLSQDDAFRRRQLRFPYLLGHRRMRLIDIQNTLCEIDKYLRIYRPDIQVGPKTIKQRFSPEVATLHGPIIPFYPPKWQYEKD